MDHFAPVVCIKEKITAADSEHVQRQNVRGVLSTFCNQRLAKLVSVPPVTVSPQARSPYFFFAGTHFPLEAPLQPIRSYPLAHSEHFQHGPFGCRFDV